MEIEKQIGILMRYLIFKEKYQNCKYIEYTHTDIYMCVCVCNAGIIIKVSLLYLLKNMNTKI